MFYPHFGGNQVVTPAAASAQISIRGGSNAIRLVNSGASICYVRVGSGTLVATTADIPIRSGESVVIGKSNDSDALAHISAAGTTLNVQTGEDSE